MGRILGKGEKMGIKVWFDGSCEPNPGGKAGFGWFIKINEESNFSGHGQIGEGFLFTNNVAEYVALCQALEFLKNKALFKERVDIYGDSNLVVKQMRGEWKANGGSYFPWFKKACEVAMGFTNIGFHWIPREQNKIADELSTRHLKKNTNKDGATYGIPDTRTER